MPGMLELLKSCMAFYNLGKILVRLSLEHVRTAMVARINCGASLGKLQVWSSLPGLNLGVQNWLDIAVFSPCLFF